MSKANLILRVILPFAVGYFVTMIFRSMNAVLAHPLMVDLSISSDAVGLLTSTYVLMFALTQIPLGLLLDRWGARLTQTLFYIVGGIGIIVFALSSHVWSLALGRGILGIGMAGGLMAAFKAISDWYDKDSIPFYNGIILAAGGLGAIVATTPVKLLEIHYGWRTLCISLGILTFIVALFILFVAPGKRKETTSTESLLQQIKSFKLIFTDSYFWRVTIIFMLTLGGFIAMQGLWLGLWIQHVVHVSPLHSANYLLAIAIAMTIGLLSGGLFSSLSKRFNISLNAIVIIGIIIHVLTQIYIIINWHTNNYIIWLLYGYFAQVTLVNYALIAQYFEPKMVGRAITASNVFVFIFAFILQYAFGLIIHLWPHEGTAIPMIAYQTAFSGLVVLEILALIWLWLSKPKLAHS